MSDLMDALRARLAERTGFYEVCGIIDKEKRVYPLGSDTKVLSTIFELIARPVVFQLALEGGYDVKEPDSQNVYPDFTLMKGEADRAKMAIDVKTTYRKRQRHFQLYPRRLHKLHQRGESGKEHRLPLQ